MLFIGGQPLQAERSCEIIRGLSVEQFRESIEMLNRSDTIDGLMHESIDPDNPWRFTRPEFGWANAFWADLIFRAVAGYPATPLGLFNRTATPSEQQSQIPTLTPRWKQVADRAEILRTLGRLLEQASRSW